MDSLVERIGRIPFRLTRHFDRIRATFKKHAPSILIGDHIGSGGFADVFKATSDYNTVTDFTTSAP